MARVRRIEIVEIPVEQLSFAPGRRVDRPTTTWWSNVRRAGQERPQRASVERLWAASVRVAPGSGDPGPAFWRVIEIRGDRLADVLGGWWEHEEHDDGHLRLESPRPIGEAWSLPGALRATSLSRWLPVELTLSPRLGPWTLLELIPRRSVHTSATYFRVGHRCLDRFVGALGAHDDGVARARTGVRQLRGQ